VIIIKVSKTQAKVLKTETLTAGQYNAVSVKFTFSSEWDGLTRLAVFKGNGITRTVILDDTNTCYVPAEVTPESGYYVYAGAYGMRDGNIIIPTVNVLIGKVFESAEPGQEAEAITPDLWQQTLTKLDAVESDAENAKNIALSIETRANNGDFKGEKGEALKYEDLTDEQKKDLLKDKADTNHSHTAADVGAYSKQEVDSLITESQNEIYLVSYQMNEKIDEAARQANSNFSEKNHTHVFANYTVQHQDRISLLGITEITEQTELSYPSCHEKQLQAGGEMPTSFFVNFKGSATIEIRATGMMMNDPLWDTYIDVDGVELVGEKISDTEAKYIFSGDINDGVTLTGTYTVFDFVTFSGNRVIYSDGFMSGKQAEKLDNLDTKIGDIDTALDAILAIQAEYIGGDEV